MSVRAWAPLMSNIEWSMYLPSNLYIVLSPKLECILKSSTYMYIYHIFKAPFKTAFNENFLVHIPIRFLSSVTRRELDHFFYIYRCKVHFHKKYCYLSYHNRGVNTQDNLAWISKVLISSVISLCLPPLDKKKTVYTIGPVYTRCLIHETKFI